MFSGLSILQYKQFASFYERRSTSSEESSTLWKTAIARRQKGINKTDLLAESAALPTGDLLRKEFGAPVVATSALSGEAVPDARVWLFPSAGGRDVEGTEPDGTFRFERCAAPEASEKRLSPAPSATIWTYVRPFRTASCGRAGRDARGLRV